MKRNYFAPLAIGTIAVAVLAGCRGGLCNTCGGYGYAPQPAYQPGTVVAPQGTFAQPNYAQPGVIVPQQVVPAQSQPGTFYEGSGTR